MSTEKDIHAVNLVHLYDEELTEEEKNYSPFLDELLQVENRYVEKEFLAEGGMKKVYSVIDLKLNKRLAYAELQQNDKDKIESFLLEARITSLLDHPNIIKIHDIDVNKEGNPYVTMDLKSGDSLDKHIKEKQALGLNELLDIFNKVCDAVSYAHSKNVLHLDLKPDNIQIGKFGEVTVCDWGIAKVIGEDDKENSDIINSTRDLMADMTLYGYIKGTPGYMAPELIDKSSEKSVETDIFALGCILYFMITAKSPFKDNSLEETLKKTLENDISFKDFKAPNSIICVIKKCLQPNPTHRYRSVLELKNDLARFQMNLPVSAEKPSLVKKSLLFCKRNSALLYTSIFILFISLVFLTFHNFKLNTANKKERQSREEAQTNLKILEEQLMREFNQKSGIYMYHSTDAAINSAIKSFELAMEVSDNDDIRKKHLYLLFVSQRFLKINELAELYRKEKPEFLEKLDKTELVPLFISQSKNFTEDDFERGLLKEEKFIQLGSGPVGERLLLCEKMLQFDQTKRRNRLNYFPIIKHLVSSINKHNKGPSGRLSYDLETKTLKVNSQKYKKFIGVHAQLNLFRFLDVDIADFSNSGLKSVDDLKGLDMIELNIANTSVYKLKAMEEFTRLEKLTIHKNQISKKQLNSLSPSIKVIVLE